MYKLLFFVLYICMCAFVCVECVYSGVCLCSGICVHSEGGYVCLYLGMGPKCDSVGSPA